MARHWLGRTAGFFAGWLLAAMLPMAVHARPLTIVNFGGANGQAQAAAFVQPFAQARREEVVTAAYNGGLKAIDAMVSRKLITWDVVDVAPSDLIAGCAAGLFERIDRRLLPNAAVLLPGAVHECGVGAFVWSTVLVHNAGQFKEPPKNWGDFWNVAKYPGKRGLRRGARYNLEIALMADGVARSQVYAELGTEPGVARALAKLAQLKPHIVWWDSNEQPLQWLATHEVAMSSVYNGRVHPANQTRATKVDIVWTDAIYALDYWVIVKGSPSRELAHAFMDFAISERAQLAFSREIAYGPTHMQAIMNYEQVRPVQQGLPFQAVIDLSMSPSDLPSAPSNLRKSLAFNAAFWGQKGSDLEGRFERAMGR